MSSSWTWLKDYSESAPLENVTMNMSPRPAHRSRSPQPTTSRSAENEEIDVEVTTQMARSGKHTSGPLQQSKICSPKAKARNVKTLTENKLRKKNKDLDSLNLRLAQHTESVVLRRKTSGPADRSRSCSPEVDELLNNTQDLSNSVRQVSSCHTSPQRRTRALHNLTHPLLQLETPERCKSKLRVTDVRGKDKLPIKDSHPTLNLDRNLGRAHYSSSDESGEDDSSRQPIVSTSGQSEEEKDDEQVTPATDSASRQLPDPNERDGSAGTVSYFIAYTEQDTQGGPTGHESNVAVSPNNEREADAEVPSGKSLVKRSKKPQNIPCSDSNDVNQEGDKTGEGTSQARHIQSPTSDDTAHNQSNSSRLSGASVKSPRAVRRNKGKRKTCYHAFTSSALQQDSEEDFSPRTFPKMPPLPPSKVKKPNSKFGKRLARKAWTLTEQRAVIRGVEKFGLGKWNEIRLHFYDILEDRSNVDIKDKWRLMQRNAGSPIVKMRKDKKFKKRQQRKWSELEEKCLYIGCLDYGQGHWAAIMERYADVFLERTSVDLKDKFRTMRHNGTFSYYEQITKEVRNFIQDQLDEMYYASQLSGANSDHNRSDNS